MQEIIDQLNELLSDASISDRFLKKVDKLRVKANKAISDASYKIQLLNAGTDSDSAVEACRTIALDLAPEIYIQEVRKAVNKNIEFSNPVFLPPLLDIADDPDLFSMVIKGAGWNRRAVVYVLMDAVAGTIGDYAQAVEDTREYLNVGKGDPVKASELWKKYYKSNGNIYSKTIRTRMEFANSPAPYWSILNYGNKVNMASDRGGYAYPDMPGTGFVEATQDRIEEAFATNFSIFKNNSTSDLRELKDQVEKVKQLLRELDKLIEQLFDNIDEAESTTTKADIVADNLNEESLELAKKVKTKTGGVVSKVKSIAKAVGSAISRLFGIEE